MIGTIALALIATLAAQQATSPESAEPPLHDPNVSTSDVAPAPDPQLADLLRGGERGDATEIWSVRRVYVIVHDASDPAPERRRNLTAAVSKLIGDRFGVEIADRVADADAVVSVTLDRVGSRGEAERYSIAGFVVRTQGTMARMRVIFTCAEEAPTAAAVVTAFVSSLVDAANRMAQ